MTAFSELLNLLYSTSEWNYSIKQKAFNFTHNFIKLQLKLNLVSRDDKYPKQIIISNPTTFVGYIIYFNDLSKSQQESVLNLWDKQNTIQTEHRYNEILKRLAPEGLSNQERDRRYKASHRGTKY